MINPAPNQAVDFIGQPALLPRFHATIGFALRYHIWTEGCLMTRPTCTLQRHSLGTVPQAM